jgi:hypothetical protein
MILLFVLPVIAGMTDVSYHARPLAKRQSCELCAQWLGLPQMVILLISASQIARITDLCCSAKPIFII